MYCHIRSLQQIYQSVSIINKSGAKEAHTCTKRQATQHGCLPSLLGRKGTNELKKCTVRKKLFCTGQPRQNKNLLYRHEKLNKQPKKDPICLYSLSPHSPQFQQSAGATPLQSLCSYRTLHVLVLKGPTRRARQIVQEKEHILAPINPSVTIISNKHLSYSRYHMPCGAQGLAVT